MSDLQAFTDQMRSLRHAYAAQLPTQVRQIEALWAAACRGTGTQDDLYALYQAVHQLHGSGTTFGLDGITEATVHLQRVLMDWLACGTAPSLGDQARVRADLVALRALATRPASITVDLAPDAPPRPSPPAPPDEAAAAPPPTILIAEDGAFLRTRVALSLRVAGYAVFEVDNGLKALTMARTHQPDLILMDVMMPGMDGLDAVQRLRDDAALASVQIIVMTVQNTVEAVQRAFTCGIDDFLVKPFSQDQLIERVEACLASA